MSNDSDLSDGECDLRLCGIDSCGHEEVEVEHEDDISCLPVSVTPRLPLSVQLVRTRLRRRRYCISLNNPTPLDAVRWQAIVLDGSVVEGCEALSFFVCQTERGLVESTLHYQGYCEFSRAVDWSVVKNIFGLRIHVEASRGNAASNIMYCTKTESRFTGSDLCVHGTWGHAKKAGSDLQAAVIIANGGCVDDLIKSHPLFVLNKLKKIEAFMGHIKGPRSELPKIEVFFGKTGAGKSRYVFEKYGVKAYWVPPPTNGGKVWFGHYTGQDVCVFDDFHAGWFQLTHLLRILDRYPLLVPPKGGQVPFNSKHLVFTTNVDPRDWYRGYKGAPEHKLALARRINEYVTVYDCSRVRVRGVTTTGFRYDKTRMHLEKRTGTFTFRQSSYPVFGSRGQFPTSVPSFTHPENGFDEYGN